MKNILLKTKSLMRSRELWSKVLISVLVVIFLYIALTFITAPLDRWLSSIPFISDYYTAIKYPLTRRTMPSLFILTFLGSLFFVSFPGELFFFHYASRYNPLLVAIIMIGSSMIAQYVNYWLGFSLGKKILKMFIAKARGEYGVFFKKYSVLLIVLVNMFPLSGDVVTTILGTIGYPKKKAFMAILIGQSLKYLVLIFGVESIIGINYVLFKMLNWG